MHQKRKRARLFASLTALTLVATSIPQFTTRAANDDNAGYLLRGETGYLTVAGGVLHEGNAVDFYVCDGIAGFNTWYFTETATGITLESGLGSGYYLATADDNLVISTTPTTFTLDGDTLTDSTGKRYATFSKENVTNPHTGDVNSDGIITGSDLSYLRWLLAHDKSDFALDVIGDTDGDGVLSANDVTVLEDYLLRENITLSAVGDIPTASYTPAAEDLTPSTTTTTPTTTTSTTTTTTSDRRPSGPNNTTSTTTEATTTTTTTTSMTTTITTAGSDSSVLTWSMDDMPAEYQYPADWIWENRIQYEDSTGSKAQRYNLIFDQIIAGDGTLNFVVEWQSRNTITLEERQQLEVIADKAINDWTDWLIGDPDWPYDHVEVNIVGWAVVDESCLLDLQPDEVVWTTVEDELDTDADATVKQIPCAPDELSRFVHFTEPDYIYPGTRFDMYLWATQGWGDWGGCGGDWGQRLSDTYYLGLCDGTDGYSIHILEHEIGHGFGLPDFYGEEGESDGYPPGGFPNDEWSIMCAGSCLYINDFDGWMLRYIWNEIKNEKGRFN